MFFSTCTEYPVELMLDGSLKYRSTVYPLDYSLEEIPAFIRKAVGLKGLLAHLDTVKQEHWPAIGHPEKIPAFLRRRK
jgi:hypothetical protein